MRPLHQQVRGIVVFPASDQGVQPVYRFPRPPGGVILHLSTTPAGKNLTFVMSTTHCVWDGNSQTELVYDDELDYNNLWEPWKNTIVSVKTATTNISHLQKIAKRKNKQIKTENIAQALENINLLQHTITIQIASNGNFVSIEFDKQEIMEQFCCKPLSIHGFNVTFYPERRKNDHHLDA